MVNTCSGHNSWNKAHLTVNKAMYLWSFLPLLPPPPKIKKRNSRAINQVSWLTMRSIHLCRFIRIQKLGSDIDVKQLCNSRLILSLTYKLARPLLRAGVVWATSEMVCTYSNFYKRMRTYFSMWNSSRTCSLHTYENWRMIFESPCRNVLHFDMICLLVCSSKPLWGRSTFSLKAVTDDRCPFFPSGGML